MPDYTLVPVDYQPDFGDYSLVPVDYDPFAADGGTAQQGQAQPAQPQPGQAQSQSPPQAAPSGQPNPTAPARSAIRGGSGFSLVPVDYQPNFDGCSLVPVDYDPFAGDDVTAQIQQPQNAQAQAQQAQTQAQPAQTQPQTAPAPSGQVAPSPIQPAQAQGQTQQPATGTNQPAANRLTPDNAAGGSGGIAGIERFGGTEGGDFPSRNAGVGYESAESAWYAALKEMQDLGAQYYPEEAKRRGFLPELGVEIFKRGGQYYYDKIARGFQDGRLGGGVGFDDSGAVARGHMHWDNQRESDGDRDNAGAWSQRTPDYKAWVGSWDGFRLYWYNGKLTESRMPDWNRYKY